MKARLNLVPLPEAGVHRSIWFACARHHSSAVMAQVATFCEYHSSNQRWFWPHSGAIACDLVLCRRSAHCLEVRRRVCETASDL